jgi:hypothetical protein
LRLVGFINVSLADGNPHTIAGTLWCGMKGE